MRITEIEDALTHAGVPFRRDFEWNKGWTFSVRGEVVGRGKALGLLEWNLAPWWREFAPTLDTAGEEPPPS